MNKSLIAILVLVALVFACKEKRKPSVLVFSKTAGYRHESIGPGKLALIKLGEKNGFHVDTTEDASAFTEENLKKYSAVIFLSTTQNVLNTVQQADFKRFIEAGGGYVGIHAAADTEYEWPWYGKLVGAYFKSHPQIQEAKLKKVRAFGPDVLPDVWVRTDEWYNYKKISKDINVIYSLDESSYKGGQNGSDHPIAWYHEFEGGRAFYTGLGHTNESYTDSLFLEHVLEGIQYAVGENEPLDYKAVKTKRAPEENRFTKMVLEFNLNEPTEMTILPDGRIIFIERKGDIKLYDEKTNKVRKINHINPWTKEEDGLIGLTADPDFSRNNFIYVFYSHPEKSANVLSRFVFKNDSLDLSSEKEILEVKTQRQTCCHTGGSLQFAKDRILFISTGDNTNPFKSDGFSPSDERPDSAAFDAQSTSANTNDLRGKILRIRINEDGTYSIPDGNLFPKDDPKARPEIYVMGNRNPYRISIDSKTGYLYWGEVGPDAGKDDSIRGPRGYDEVNQAKKAGFFGWPYFVGNNYAYGRHNFATKQTGAKWDAARPVNESPNNTGLRDLPPAQPPLVWYPYDKADDFPMVREGGRNAMAGPIYYSDQYKGSETAFPDYMDGKVMIYDWMRNWIFLVTLDENGNILDMEPFMENTKFNNIIDMAYGPDGRLYMIEYGTAWFKQNMDARLVRIDYNGGNRAPVIQLAADKQSGAIPLTVNFTSEGSIDYDGDKLTYELQIGDKKLSSADGKFTHTFDKAGSYDVKLVGKDDEGLANQSMVKIIAGNSPPEIDIAIRGNSSFYFPGTPVQYEVTVRDQEDGTSADGKIAREDVKVTFDYLKGFDMAGIAKGHQMQIPEHPGKSLMDKSDCKSCHLIDQKSAGPGYKEIARVYRTQKGSADKLAEKIIRGGAGVWGSTEMAAHPQLSLEDARKMVDYIFTLGEEKENRSLPLKGTVIPGKETDGAYILTASYGDKGASGVPSLSVSGSRVLRAPKLGAADAAELRGPRVFTYEGQKGLENIRNNSMAVYKEIDLTSVAAFSSAVYVMPNQHSGGQLEVRMDAPDGPLLGELKIAGQGLLAPSVKISPQTGLHDVYLVFKNPEASDRQLFFFSELRLQKR
jgi:cytochrome c